jgi:hypothetical protein
MIFILTVNKGSVVLDTTKAQATFPTSVLTTCAGKFNVKYK